VLGYKDLVSHYHLPFANKIQAEIPFRRRGYLRPRLHFKSTIIAKSYPLWRICGGGWEPGSPDPRNLRILIAAESDDVACKNIKDPTWHVQNNQLLRALFPEIIPPDFDKVAWRLDRIELNRPNSFDESSITAVGIGAKHTGFHYDILVFDDPIGDKAAASEALMDAAKEWWAWAAGLANNPATFEELYAGTRWKHGKADLPGYIMEEMTHNDEQGARASGYKWDVQGCYDENGNALFTPRFTNEILADIRRREGEYKFSCFARGTKVLMSDLIEKPIESLEVGDEIVGFEPSDGDENLHGKLVKAVVKFVNQRQAEVFKFTMKSGREVICTPDHKFYSGCPHHSASFRPINVKGDGLISVYTSRDLTPYEQRMLDWLGGIFDGEGTTAGSYPGISQSPSRNPEVTEAIRRTLEALRIEYTFNQQSDGYNLHGGRSLSIFLVNNALMAKRQRFADLFWKKSRRIGCPKAPYDEVIDVSEVGTVPVWNITSSSGNYVANGFAVANCNFLNDPCAPEGSRFTEQMIKTFHIEIDSRDNKRDLIVPNDGSSPVKLKALARISFNDPSSGGSSAECEHAICCLGMASDGRKFAFKVWSENAGFRAAAEQWFRMNDQFMCWPNYFEAIGAHKELATVIGLRELEKECSICRKKHRRLNPVPITPPGGSINKEDRILTFCQQDFEEGKIYIHENDMKTKRQILEFPHGALVDRLDALAYACHLSRRPHTVEELETITAVAEQAGRAQQRTSQSYDVGGYI
jgi:hypothetical protein